MRSVSLLVEIKLVAGLLLEDIKHLLEHVLVVHADIGDFVLIVRFRILHHLKNDNLAVVVIGRQQYDILVAFLHDGGAELKLHIGAVFIGQNDDVIILHLFHIIHG